MGSLENNQEKQHKNIGVAIILKLIMIYANQGMTRHNQLDD